MGFIFVPLTTASLAEIPRAALPNATGIYTLVRQLGGSLGIALLQLLETRREAAAQAALSASVNLSNQSVAQALAQNPNHAQVLSGIYGLVQQNATVVAYDYIFRLSAIVFFLTIPAVFLLAGRAAPGSAIPLAE